MKNIESVRKLKESLLRHYGATLESVRIFGSVARDTSGPLSDIDVMIILDQPSRSVNWRTEREIRSLAYPIELEEDVVFDLKVLAKEDLENIKGHTPFMERVRSEGVRI
ncbi:MAG: nucleotidyltransferase family protein [Syntrophales bacterium]